MTGHNWDASIKSETQKPSPMPWGRCNIQISCPASKNPPKVCVFLHFLHPTPKHRPILESSFYPWGKQLPGILAYTGRVIFNLDFNLSAPRMQTLVVLSIPGEDSMQIPMRMMIIFFACSKPPISAHGKAIWTCTHPHTLFQETASQGSWHASPTAVIKSSVNCAWDR